MIKNLWENLRGQWVSRWVACSIIPDKRSAQYGMYFSYPVYIIIVLTGILLKNPYIILAAAMIAFLAIKLPMHPFDYIYNTVAKLIGTMQIPGRGSELQVNSTIALVFNLVVFALVVLEIPINFSALAIIYAFSSIFFIGIFLLKD